MKQEWNQGRVTSGLSFLNTSQTHLLPSQAQSVTLPARQEAPRMSRVLERFRVPLRESWEDRVEVRGYQ